MTGEKLSSYCREALVDWSTSTVIWIIVGVGGQCQLCDMKLVPLWERLGKNERMQVVVCQIVGVVAPRHLL